MDGLERNRFISDCIEAISAGCEAKAQMCSGGEYPSEQE
jgi:hypothetical protein